MKFVREFAMWTCFCIVTSGCLTDSQNKSGLACYHRLMLGKSLDHTMGFMLYLSTLSCEEKVFGDLKTEIRDVLSRAYNEEEDDIIFTDRCFWMIVQGDQDRPWVVGVPDNEDLDSFFVMPIYQLEKMDGGYLFYECKFDDIRRFRDGSLASELRRMRRMYR